MGWRNEQPPPFHYGGIAPMIEAPLLERLVISGALDSTITPRRRPNRRALAAIAALALILLALSLGASP